MFFLSVKNLNIDIFNSFSKLFKQCMIINLCWVVQTVHDSKPLLGSALLTSFDDLDLI